MQLTLENTIFWVIYWIFFSSWYLLMPTVYVGYFTGCLKGNLSKRELGPPSPIEVPSSLVFPLPINGTTIHLAILAQNYGVIFIPPFLSNATSSPSASFLISMTSLTSPYHHLHVIPLSCGWWYKASIDSMVSLLLLCFTPRVMIFF